MTGTWRLGVIAAVLGLGAAAGACGDETAATGDGATTTTGGAGGNGGDGATGAGATGGSGGGTGGAATGGGGSAGDFDEDGLDDGLEDTLARASFPFLSVHPNDACPLHGVLYRLSPHPANAALVMIWYVVLFQNDCGTNGHVGDDEVMGVVVDPSMPAPAGILAIRAISHQDTFCEGISSCGTLPSCDACATAMKNGQTYPVAFPSVDKHGLYVDEVTCDNSVVCDFGGCQIAPTSSDPPFVNAGEPGHPLVDDLTTQGFITAANGWTEPELMNFDPWGGQDFGGAGNVTDDLQDPAFVIDPGGCN